MRRHLILLLAGLAGFSLALVAGIAGAKSFTLNLAKSEKVTNQSGTTKHEKVAVTSRGFAVYWLSGDSAAHPKCTSPLMRNFSPRKRLLADFHGPPLT